MMNPGICMQPSSAIIFDRLILYIFQENTVDLILENGAHVVVRRSLSGLVAS